MRVTSGQPWRRLDASVLTRLEPDVAEIAGAAIDQVLAGSKQPLDESTVVNLRTTVTAALTAFFAEIGHPEAAADREVYRARGRAQHAAGRSLEEMLSFYQLGALGVWRQLTSSAHAADLSIQAVVELGEALFAFIAELSAAAAEGYADARSQAARAGQAHRDQLLGLLLADPPAAAEVLDVAARQASWLLPDQVAIAVTSADAAADLLDQMPNRVLVGRRHDLTVAVMPADRIDWYLGRLGGLLGQHQAALGPVCAVRAAARSARRATSLWHLSRAGALGTQPIIRVEDHHIDLLLTADGELATEFAREVLVPLAGLAEPVRDRLTDTLAAWLARPDQPQAIGAELHVHVQTVRYRLRQLRTLFGSVIDDPAGRFALAIALRVHPHLSSSPLREPTKGMPATPE